MANLLKTRRDMDIALFELQTEMENVYQKWQLEFDPQGLAHKQALPEPGQQPMQVPTPAPQQGY